MGLSHNIDIQYFYSVHIHIKLITIRIILTINKFRNKTLYAI